LLGVTMGKGGDGGAVKAVVRLLHQHRHVQPMLDEAQRIQIDIAKLNLIKLQLEVDKLQRKGVDTP